MKIILLIAVFLISNLALAQERFQSQEAPLDPPYHHLKLFQANQISEFSSEIQNRSRLPSVSDIKGLIAKQTPIRDQSARGTCSIFASIGLLESLLLVRNLVSAEIDLSEEWLEYAVAMNRNGAEGSSGPLNFEAFTKYGEPNETSMPYLGQDWTEVKTQLAKERCGKVPTALRPACYVGHFDPRLMEATETQLSEPSNPLFDRDFLAARHEAFQFRDQIIASHLTSSNHSVSMFETKKLLSKGTPVQVDLDFYYGAWNHRLGPQYGIPRNMEHYASGIVGYPEVGSLDRKESEAHPEGHAVVLVGYDDNKEIQVDQKMEDGSTKSFTYRGVFYFKNSWGTSSFGVNFELDGVPHPGFGMMTQKYAEEFGSFFQFPLE